MSPDRNMILRAARFLWLWTLATVTLHADIDVRLDLAPGGGFDVQYALSTGQSTNGRDALSGHILAKVQISRWAEVTSLKLVGGRVAHRNTTLEIPLSTSVLGTSKVRIALAGVATQPLTRSGVGWVDAESGILTNAGHRMISNEGTITTRYLVGTSVLAQETRNLATQPDDTALEGITTVTATLLEETGYWKRYRINLHHTRDEFRTQWVSGVPTLPVGTTLTIREEGEFYASGEVLVPGNDFEAWASTSRGVVGGELDTLDPVTGQPLLVMYALGGGAGAWSLPVEVDASAGILRLQSSLPLRAPVVWEYSQTMAPGSWQLLPSGRVEQGAAGEQTIPLPPGEQLFLRVHVPLP